MTRPQGYELVIPRRLEWALLVLILLVAVFLRLYRLDSIPPGLTHDEADFSHDAIAVYNGARPLYVATYGYQDEPFMHYASAMMMILVGPSYLAVRATSALFGVILVLFVFLWARLAFGTIIALGAAAWLAVSYWPVSTSRFAIQTEPTASLTVLTVTFFWLGMGIGRQPPDVQPQSWWRPWVYWGGFSLFVTASIYAYEAFRIAWVMFPLFVFYLIIVRSELPARHWWRLALALLIAALLSLPLLTHPAALSRASILAGPLEAAMKGSLGPLLKSFRDVAAMFTFKGDPFTTYNLSGRPILDPVTSLFFYGGILLCLWQWRRPVFAFTLFWLVAGIAPSMLTGVHSASVRSIAAQPVTYIFPALALDQAIKWLARRARVTVEVILLVGLLLVMVGSGLLTGFDYFVRWANAPETQAAYFSDLVQAIQYADTNYVAHRSILFSSPFPNLPHDPYIAAVMPVRHDLDIRWVDGRRALLFPTSSSARLVVLSRSPLAALFSTELDARRITRVTVEGSDNFFDVFDWEPENTLNVIRRSCDQVTMEPNGQWSLPVTLAHSVQLTGYGLEPLVVTSGGTLRIVTRWHVLDPQALGPVLPGLYGHDVNIFVHVLNSDNEVVAQEDRLDFPAWDWRSGDTFVQIHHIAIAPDISPGRYQIEVGMYTEPDLKRLLVYDDDEVVGDHVLLRSVEITSQ